METVGQVLRNKRQKLGLLLRQVSSYVDIDQAILSKIERSERKPTKIMLIRLAEILELDKDELLIHFISDKIAYEIAYEIADEDCAKKVLIAAERKVKYLKIHPSQNKLWKK